MSNENLVDANASVDPNSSVDAAPPPAAPEPVVEPSSSVDPNLAASIDRGSVAVTNEIVNPKTGETYPIDPNDTQAFLAKGYVRSEDFKKTNIVDPNTGEVLGQSLPQDLDAFLAKGYKTDVQYSQHKSLVQQKLKQLESKENGGGVLGFGASDMDVAAAGLASPIQGLANTIAAKVYGVSGQEDDLKAEDEARQIYTGEKPGMYWAGKIPGEVATAVGLGGIAGAATEGLGISGLAKIATEGAIYAAPDAMQNVLESKYKEAGELLAIGAGLNIGLHGIGSAAKGVAKGIEGLAEPAVSNSPEEIESLSKLEQAKDAAQKEYEESASHNANRYNDVAITDLGKKERRAKEILIKATKDLQDHPEYNDIYKKSATNAAEIGAARKSLDEAQEVLQKHPEYTESTQDLNGNASTTYKQLYKNYQDAQQDFIKATKGNATVPAEASDEYKKLYENYQDAQQSYLSYKNSTAERITAKVINQRSIAKEALDEATEALESHPLYQKQLEERRIAANTLGSKLGLSPDEIHDNNKIIQDLPKLIDLNENDTLSTISKKITAARDSSGESIGKAMENLDNLRTSTSEIYVALRKSINDIDTKISSSVGVERDQVEKTLSPLRKQIKDELVRGVGATEARNHGFITNEEKAEYLAKYGDKEKPLTFTDTTQRLKKWWGDQVNWNGADNNFVNRQRIAGDAILRKNFAEAEDDVIKGADPAKLGGKTLDAIRKDRLIYGASKTFKDIADKLGTKDVLKTPLSGLMDMIKGQSGHLSAYSLGGLALHTIGGAGLMGAGAGLVAVANIVNRFSEKALLGKSINILKGSSKIGVDISAEAMKATSEHITSNIGDLFDWKNAGGKIAKYTATKGAINSLLPNNGVGLSESQKVATLRDQTNKLLTDPQYAANHWQSHPITTVLRNDGLPQVAQAYQDHTMRLAKVIQMFLPPSAKSVAANPFAANVTEADVPPAAMARINKVAAISSDPTVLIGMVKDNSITPADVAIAAAVNPQFLNKMKMELLDEQLKSKSQGQNLSFQNRLSLGILMGMNIDAATEQKNVATLQQTYVPFQNPQGGGGGKKSSKAPSNLDEVSDSFKTGSQNATIGTE